MILEKVNTGQGSKGEELGAVFFISLAAHLTPGTQAEARELQSDQIRGKMQRSRGEVPGISSRDYNGIGNHAQKITEVQAKFTVFMRNAGKPTKG